jgi:3'-phosphoadenosine 5'-phosphosulfate sulfotransferase (PAPS reductase)/FAD synthetase
MVVTDTDDIDPEYSDFALFSGGNDSIVSTHRAYDAFDVDMTVYLDTNSGLPANLDHVKDVCDEYGWELAVLSSPITLRGFALGSEDRQAYGFPGPGSHSWAYNMFKQRQIRSLASAVSGEPTLYTGVRQHESDRRMRHVNGDTDEGERWTWRATIHNWRDERVDEYRETHDLPTNPVAEKIGRSGDCYCGAFANRDTELAELEAHYPDHAEYLKELEAEVQAARDERDEYAYWGFGGLSEKELRGKMADDDMAQMSLCSTCDVPDYPTDEKLQSEQD